MIRLIFFDVAEDRIEEYKKVIQAPDTDTSVFDVMFLADDVRDVLEDNFIDILVSPANSHGFMDGGIDDVYREMFPNIQGRVQEYIERYQLQTPLGAFVLPVGSAILVPTFDERTKLLACVPTMMLPENIVGTYNVYWAMRGLLKLLDKIMTKPLRPNVLNVAIPCMGTGVGGLSSNISAKQILAALSDHSRKNVSICDPNIADPNVLTTEKDWAYVLSNHACPGPTVEEK